jgi:hypothetical protein
MKPREGITGACGLTALCISEGAARHIAFFGDLAPIFSVNALQHTQTSLFLLDFVRVRSAFTILMSSVHFRSNLLMYNEIGVRRQGRTAHILPVQDLIVLQHIDGQPVALEASSALATDMIRDESWVYMTRVGVAMPWHDAEAQSRIFPGNFGELRGKHHFGSLFDHGVPPLDGNMHSVASKTNPSYPFK